MIERLDLLNIEGHHNQIAIKINELIDIVKAHDKQIQACMQRTIDLEDTALDTKQEKCPTCGGNGEVYTSNRGNISLEIKTKPCPKCSGTGTIGEGKK